MSDLQKAPDCVCGRSAEAHVAPGELSACYGYRLPAPSEVEGLLERLERMEYDQTLRIHVRQTARAARALLIRLKEQTDG